MTAISLPPWTIRSYTVHLVTPAFLGNAEQRGAWRTPPFKALLRQWWRVAIAQKYNYDYQPLRQAEGELFGHAWLNQPDNSNKTWAMRSRVQLRLSPWRESQSEWNERSGTLWHPEAGRSPQDGRHIDPFLYLGYGPLNNDKEQRCTIQKINASIQANESITLQIIFPTDDTSEFSSTLQLIQWFGTLGGRSRNGWGSLEITEPNIKGVDSLLNKNVLLDIARPLSECLQLDWPHAIGTDNGGLLVWRTKEDYPNWQETMKELARIKISFRTHGCFRFSRNRDYTDPRIDLRHVLAYPVTHHGVRGWCEEENGQLKKDHQNYLKQNARLANQLRFKVIKLDTRYIGIAYHLPCGIPSNLLAKLAKLDNVDCTWIKLQQLTVWQSVHRLLNTEMQRL